MNRETAACERRAHSYLLKGGSSPSPNLSDLEPGYITLPRSSSLPPHPRNKMWSSSPLKRDSSGILPRRNQNSPPPLLISVPLPTSSPCRAPKPPPSSPIRVRPSAVRRDSEDLIFAMSPDQNGFPHIPPGFNSLQSAKPPVAPRYPTKNLVDRSTLKNPYPFRIFFDSQTHPAEEDEKPVLYPVPTIKKSPSRQRVSATPKSKCHALLKPFASSTRLQSAPICSGSTTSEDEDEFLPVPGSILPSPTSVREIGVTVDILDDISTVSHSPPRTGSEIFSTEVFATQPAPTSPSVQHHRRSYERGSDVRMRIAESFGLDKFLGSLNPSPSPGSVQAKQVTRGRPKHRKIS